ncbi:MAG: acetyl-CoA carboxylase carboxyltransferase subunit alpha [Bacteroidetes bacterium]|jgi:acetyl-CoA carboxylase carboxyl transferase subunit alpha|nr:acetyl-CoA carboxylase carboxyltransferase subunit alpha [Bacteroidota bacterium]
MATPTALDFEQPISELESKLQDVKSLAEQNQVNMDETIEALEKKISDLKKKIYSNLSGWQRVQLARHPNRPYTLDYIYAITSNFIELHGDRSGGDDKAIVGGLAKIGTDRVVIIGHQKGRDTKSRQYRNFGMANPEGYRKALRLMKMAEKFGLPVVTLIDTPGAYPGLHAEEYGQAEAIAKNLMEMAVLRVPILCIVIGEGASGGALGIGVGDRVLMLENTWYSVISPESCSSILWRSWDYKEVAAEALKLTANDNKALGIVDGVIAEPLGGAHRDPTAMYKTLKNRITKELKQLRELSTEELLSQRIEKFAQMGVYSE